MSDIIQASPHLARFDDFFGVLYIPLAFCGSAYLKIHTIWFLGGSEQAEVESVLYFLNLDRSGKLAHLLSSLLSSVSNWPLKKANLKLAGQNFSIKSLLMEIGADFEEKRLQNNWIQISVYMIIHIKTWCALELAWFYNGIKKVIVSCGGISRDARSFQCLLSHNVVWSRQANLFTQLRLVFQPTYWFLINRQVHVCRDCTQLHTDFDFMTAKQNKNWKRFNGLAMIKR